jgi:hypothetical protein
MKFRLVATLILFVVLGLAYALFESNQPQHPQTAPSNDGLVLR